jgi:hypothetical protein
MAALEYDHDTVDIGFGEISTLGSMSADAVIVPALLIHPFAFRGGVMKRMFGIETPRTLEDVCQPRRLALLVYDMQVGITSQVKDGHLIVERVARTLKATREAGVPVIFTRHMSLSKELMGAFAYRMAMAWQHLDCSTNRPSPRHGIRLLGGSTRPNLVRQLSVSRSVRAGDEGQKARCGSG